MKKVEQFYNKNQFRIYGDNENSLQSYDSLVLRIQNKDGCQLVTFGRDWDYSNTTRKHVYMFLEEYLDSNFNLKLYNAKNKRAYIQSLIDNHTFGYNENMY